MKKILINLLMFILLMSNIKGQFKWTMDKYEHAFYGLVISGGVTGFTYNQITHFDKKTKLWKIRLISQIVGCGTGFLCAHLKEKFDRDVRGGNYNHDDIIATTYGSLIGSSMITIVIWKSIPENRLSDEEKLLIIDDYNPPLIRMNNAN